jgi:hypothetical protein
MTRENINVRITDARTSVGAIAFGTFLLLALVMTYIKWIVLIAVVSVFLVATLAFLRKWQRDAAAQAQRDAQLCVRADEQHRWFFAGDPRGMYGHEWRHSDVEQGSTQRDRSTS